MKTGLYGPIQQSTVAQTAEEVKAGSDRKGSEYIVHELGQRFGSERQIKTFTMTNFLLILACCGSYWNVFTQSPELSMQSEIC